MTGHFVELTDDETGHGVLIHLAHVNWISQRDDRKAKIHFAGSDESVIVRESVPQILEKLPRQAD